MIERLTSIATTIAQQYGLPPALVCAFCEQESNFNPWAQRFEPAFLRFYVETAPKRFGAGSLETERMARATSFGLMQVMGQTARELGFDGAFCTELCLPEVGLTYGCKYLKRQLDRYHGRYADAISAYNAGSVRKGTDGSYSNQRYVNEVTTRWKRYEDQHVG